MPTQTITLTIDVFYADEAVCFDWDAQVLADRPALADDDDESWRTQPGWYWRCEQLKEFEGGPFATREECEADARRAADAADPEAIADALREWLDATPPRGRRTTWH